MHLTNPRGSRAQALDLDGGRRGCVDVDEVQAMPRLSTVSVFAVQTDGATGDRVADGALAHPLAVLVDRHQNPAAVEAAAINGLRVGIAPGDRDRGVEAA